MNNNEIQWSTQQRDIHTGLKNIGIEISGYFKSALISYYDESFPNRVSHLAHVAREIDGGLRDILAPSHLKKQMEDSLEKEGLKQIFGLDLKNFAGNISSILVALDVDNQDELAKQWAEVSTKFHKYAHRHGAWKEAREFEEFKLYWDKYERILSRLVGSYYAIIKRIDRLIKLSTLDENALGALGNLLSKEHFANYFFHHVENPDLFFPLRDAGYFNPQNIPDESSPSLFWNALYYLERLSKGIAAGEHSKCGKELILIIDNTVQYSRQTRRLNNSYIWMIFAKILNNLPTKLIYENISPEQFEVWLSQWADTKLNNDIAINTISANLLGKFLENKASVPFAEAIIKTLTRIRPADKNKQKSVIAHDRPDAQMAWKPYWILQGFRKNNDKIGQFCSVNSILDLAHKLKLALDYKQQDFDTNLKIGDFYYNLNISKIPKDNLSEEEMGFQEGIFSFEIKQYAQEDTKDVEDYWALHSITPSIPISGPIQIQGHTNEEFLASLSENLPKNIKWSDAEDYSQKINRLYEGLFADYSYIWLPTLSDSDSVHEEDAQAVLAVILKDILLSKCKTNKEQATQLLNAFLEKDFPFPIFKRFILLVIYENPWEIYGDFLEKLLKIVPKLFDKSDYETELFNILKKHNSAFDDQLKRLIKDRIEQVPEYYKKEGSQYVASWKYKWLSPLKDNPFFNDDYKQAKNAVGKQSEDSYKPDDRSNEVRWVQNKSPKSQDELLALPIEELIEFLKNFKDTDDGGMLAGKPDKEGLANELQKAVKAQPEKFWDNLELFNTNNLYFYVYRILRGFGDVWNSERDLDWSKIFSFIKLYINRPTFVDEAIKDQGEDSGNIRGKYLWVVDAIVDLIETASRKDTRAFGKEYFDDVEQIFSDLLSFVEGDPNPDTQRSAITYAINTSFGRLVESYIIFSLRVARVKEKNGETKEENWGDKKYQRFFSKTGVEPHIFLGRYLPYFKFLDLPWVLDKVKWMETKQGDPDWKQFMDAYLTGPHIDRDLYKAMHANYEFAIKNKIFKEDIDRRLVEHIVISYLRGYEELAEKNMDDSESLFWLLLHESYDDEKQDRWPEIARFLGSVIGRTEKKQKEKNAPQAFHERIIDLWRWIFDKRNDLKTKLKEDHYSSLLCNLAELTMLLETIDEENERWLMLSAQFVGKDSSSTFFLQYLSEIVDPPSVKRIGKIYLEILKYDPPIYETEPVRTIVKNLFTGDQEDKVTARTICNTHGEKGQYFLKDLYFANEDT